MKKTELSWLVLAAALALFGNGCSSDSDSNDPDTNGDANGSGSTRSPDLVMITRIDDVTGFMVTADVDQDTDVDSGNGVEVSPSSGLMTQGDYIYTTGLRDNDKVTKYSLMARCSPKKVSSRRVRVCNPALSSLSVTQKPTSIPSIHPS